MNGFLTLVLGAIGGFIIGASAVSNTSPWLYALMALGFWVIMWGAVVAGQTDAERKP